MKFDTFDQFERWLKSELIAWQWLVDEEKKVSGWASVSGSISPFDVISELRDAVQSAVKTKPSDNDGLRRVVSEVKRAIDENDYIPSNTKLGMFLIEEGESNPAFGLKLLETTLNEKRTYVPSDRQELLAVFALNDFKRGFSKKRLKESIDESQKIVGNLKALQTEITEIKKSNQADLDNFKKVMKEEIALKEPIDYWTQKAADHDKAKNRWGRLFTIYTITVLFLLANFILGFEDGIQGFITSWKDAGIGAVASFAGLIGIGMVIARVFYRLFASQLHLWNDARERVTMIQTYLALAAEGHAKEEFLGALMQRLFSPTSDGIVKSDLGSVGPLESALRQLNPK